MTDIPDVVPIGVSTAELGDRFIVANLKADDGGRGTIQIQVFGPNGQVVRSSSASVHYWTRGDRYVECNSCSMIFKSGETGQLLWTTTAGRVNRAYHVIAMA